MFQVIYYSCTGNTRKVAEVIATVLGTAANDVRTVDIVSQGDFIFLGTGCYQGELPIEIREFLERNRFNGRKIALFTTSPFGLDAERRRVEKQLEACGAIIVRNFKCYGRLLDINKEHPTWLELKKAAWFARSAAITLFDRHADEIEMLIPAG